MAVARGSERRSTFFGGGIERTLTFFAILFFGELYGFLPMDFAGHPCFETHSDSVCHDAGATGDAGNLGLLYVLWIFVVYQSYIVVAMWV